MRIFFTLLAIVSAGMVSAQTSEFVRLESRMAALMEKEQWDDVLVLGPDLVIEEPFRGDGYYYTAYGFMKIGELEKAADWLEKAKGMSDEQLDKKISELEELIERTALVSEAAQWQEQGQAEKSAAQWEELWKMDKSQIEYALNALDIYIVTGEYEAAMAILDDPIIQKDPSSIPLRNAVNKTPEMQQVQKFQDAVKSGNESLASGNFALAMSRFNQALEIRPSDPDARSGLAKAADEEAWRLARETDTIDSLEEYLSGGTIKNHRGEAEQILRNSMIKFGEEYAIKGDVDRMEYYLDKLKDEYALDQADVEYADGLLIATYERVAKANSREKYYNPLSNAITYYNRAGQLNTEVDYRSEIRSVERRLKRYHRPDLNYLAFVHDTVTNIGISFGGLKNRKLGFYMTYRLDTDVLLSSADYTMNEDGSFSGPMEYRDVRAEGNIRSGAMDVIFGMTKKISYPVWVYLGGGISYIREWQKMTMYDTDGVLYQTDWVSLTDREVIKPMVEVGLIVNAKRVHFRGGVKTIDFENLEDFALSFGIGYSFFE
ncbi:hypothetical protein LZF95_02040 [Algoriphagus sp. AGSA1]|uniref:tetratricopeptide repeat protein n=1 Tax=Algoriphagus sp. AGSA1 TaxID=2907213 RepID=UPI001F408D3F|nr:hypothetical protein [Algoriphagus sp. AGSA1]MCE7053440.1 hypothetical protein [Algoriphagus sp. AGSA1]